MIIAVDPSVNHVGFARWDGKEMFTKEIKPPQAFSLIRRARFIMDCIKISVTEADVFVIEYPSFQVSQRGAIAVQMGYTLDLAFLCGFLAARVSAREKVMPTPVQWKGNLNKEQVGKRFTQRYGIDFNSVSDHRYEAAMMIDWYEREYSIRPNPKVKSS